VVYFVNVVVLALDMVYMCECVLVVTVDSGGKWEEVGFVVNVINTVISASWLLL